MADNEKTLINLDSQDISLEEFNKIKEQVQTDPVKKLKEVSPGVWKTLQRLNE